MGCNFLFQGILTAQGSKLWHLQHCRLVLYQDVSVFLFEQDFCYDFFQEVKNDEPYYGNGYTYEDVFKDYLSDNYPNLSKKLEYDTEMGMFCVYCEDMKTADEVALILNDLYKDEEKMIDLIKVAKEKYNYEFDIKI